MTIDINEYLERKEEPKKKWFISESELDDEQYNVLYAEKGNLIIEGCAGSGKTNLAMHRLIKIIKEEKETALFVVFTKALKSFIESGVEANIFKKENVQICYAHQIEQKIKNNDIQSFDYVIIDEVQDLDVSTIKKILSLCKKEFIFFGDDKQQIFVEKNKGITLEQIRMVSGVSKEKYKVLNKNYRLPKQIAKLSGAIIDDNGELLSKCVRDDGTKPVLVKCKSFIDEIDFIIRKIKSERLTDVGIIYNRNELVEKARQAFESKGMEVEYKYKTWNYLNFNTDLPKIVTYHSAKGLEFDTVFLPSCSMDYEKHNYRESLYVACTRATKSLYITYIDHLTPYIKVEFCNQISF
ncbi:3'-5' exonuclease [Clostridium thermosuccinogenes]|nr:3'-5' exonuclease [Pseudoclostridium thermosuccinogenes]